LSRLGLAICKACGKKYSKWITPVSAKGICGDCFQAELSNQEEDPRQEDPEPVEVALPTQTKSGRIRFRSFLPRTGWPAVFALVMACYSITFSSLIAGWVRAAHLRKPPPSFYLRGDPADIVSLLVAAPLFESLVLVAVFELLRRFRAPERVQVFVAALFISGLHGLKWWPHAVIVLPSFCIQTASYLYWRRTSWKTAFWVVALMHALDNLLPALSAFAAYTSRHVPPSSSLLR
jgi:hypothetical protein